MGHDQIMRAEPSEVRLKPLEKRPNRVPSLLLPGEDTAGSQQSVAQRGVLPGTMLAPDLDFQPPEL